MDDKTIDDLIAEILGEDAVSSKSNDNEQPKPNRLWLWVLLALIVIGGIFGVVKLTNDRNYSDYDDYADEVVEEVVEEFVEEVAEASYNESTEYIANGIAFNMIEVEGGTFTMGPLSNDEDAFYGEGPAHSVTISDFFIGETEITQELWEAVMGYNPSSFTGDGQRPVEQVSWNDCQKFIRKLNSLTGKNFRLPTEAEWEYAARGGNKSRGYKYSGSNSFDDVAWYNDTNNSTTHPVKQKQANELGIYDMSGNVCEWCSDWYDMDYYSVSPSNNPQGPSSGSDRVYRGGSWGNFARSCRSSCRDYLHPAFWNYQLGLRLALSE